jgi:hypothetical protein
MVKFILGVAVGFVLSTVGFTGAVSMLDQGVSRIKEYTPAVESTITDVKNHVIEAAK